MRIYFNLFLICVLLGQSVKAQITFDKSYQFPGDVGYVKNLMLDDGYLMLTSAEFSGFYHLALLKTDLYGEKVWIKYHDVVMHGDMGYVRGGAVDAEGDFYISLANADYDLVKLDREGNLLWKKKYSFGYLYSGPVLSNNSVWLAIESGPRDACSLYNINPANGDTTGSILIFTGVHLQTGSITTRDNGDISIVVADHTPYTDLNDMWVYTKPADSAAFRKVKLEWPDRLHYLTQILYHDNELWVMESTDNRTIDTAYLVRYDYSGNILLRKIVPWSSSRFYLSNFTINDNDQAVVLCTIYENDWYVRGEMLCLTRGGDTLWSRNLHGNRWYTDINYCDDGGYYLTGYSPWACKTDSEGNVNKEPSSKSSVYTYPNPVSGIVTINTPGFESGIVTIYDIYGIPVTYVKIQKGTGQFDTVTLPGGIYFCSTGTGVAGKMVVR